MKKISITLDQVENETDIEKIERYIRQLGRSILACSLCPRGCKMFKSNNDHRIPHFQPSIWYKKIILIKYEPDESDIQELFYDIKPILNKYKVDLNSFYKTTIIKCAGDQLADECPYFELEWKALQKCPPNLVVCFDKKSSEFLGRQWIPNKIQDADGYKIFCVGDEYKGLDKIAKMVSISQGNSH